MEYTLIGSVTGKTPIALPDGWRELLIFYGYGSNNYTFNILDDAIPSTGRIILRGGYAYSVENVASLGISKSSVYNAGFVSDGSSVETSAKLMVWGR